MKSVQPSISFGIITAIAFLLASAVQPVTAQSMVSVESYLYEDSGPPNQETYLVDHAEDGTTEASTSSAFDPIYNNEHSGQVVMLNGYAAATPGAAHLEGDASLSRNLPNGTDPNGFEQYDSNSTVIITISDLIITGPTPTVSTKFNFLADGDAQASSSLYTAGSAGNSSSSARASFSVAVQANGTPIGNGTYTVSANNGGSPVIGAGGLLADFTGNNVVTTDSITLPTNEEITLTINTSLLSNVGLPETGSGSGLSSVNFGDTFSFATSGPVLDLPLGYTADSISGGIVANQYVAPAPEPSTCALLLVGGVLVLGACWRPILN